MGGALSNPTGNKQPSAEANFFNDAIAARMVLRAGFAPPVVLVPLDTTHTTSFRKELADALQTSGPVGRCHLSYLDLSCHLTTEQICGCLAQVLFGVLHEEWTPRCAYT
jgi:inosine-uridine nucleoside N-ribohydrolase